jgi:hypothetical protein
MFTCTKCGKKAKTSYERTFGEKPTFEPVGFYCHTCGIFYDAQSKKASKVVYGIAKVKNEDGGVRSTVAAETYTNAAQNVYESGQERIREPQPLEAWSSSSMHETRQNKWMGRDSNSRPPVCETGILTRLDYPSAFLWF